jgi:renal tumor antigen
MRRYKLVKKVGEGTFSEVLAAQSLKDGRTVALKCMKAKFTSLEQVNNLREIQALRRLSPHPNIVALQEVL